MKKILTLTFVAGMIFSAFAQDAADKKVLAGLTLGAALNFNNPQTNTIDSKTGGDFLAGMALDWNFSKNIGLSTGVEFSFNRFKTIYNDTVFFNYNDKEILRNKDYDNSNPTSHFMLAERKHKSIYLNLPIMLKFQTNYMGYMRYFGKFGLRNDFLLSTRADNKGIDLEKTGMPTGNTEVKGMRSKSLMAFYKGSIGISAGVEYNISGSTVLVAEIGYFYGFTEVFQQEGSLFGDDEKDMSLYRVEGTNVKYYSPSLKQSQLILKLAVLF